MSVLGRASPPEAQPLKEKHPYSRGTWRRAFLVWLPSVLVAGAVLLPIIYLILRALQLDPGSLDLLLRARTVGILANTVILAITVTLAATVLATTLAWLTTRTDLPWRQGWAVLTSLPLVIPSYVGAYLFVAALGPRGMVQSGLASLFGITRLPSIYGFPGAFLVITLLSFPYVLLPVRAALQRLDPAQEESARSLGFSNRETFLRVVLPQLRPAIGAGALLVALYTLRDFGAVAIMRYTTFTRAIYVQYQSAFDRSTAAGLSLVLVVITLGVLLVEMRTRQRGGGYTSDADSGVPRIPISLNRWRTPALVFCAAVTFLAVGLPTGVLGFWLARGLAAGAEVAPLVDATLNSLTASGLAAGATVLAAMPVAIMATRYPGRPSRWLERISYLGFALPGIVIALALVFFGVRAAPFLYQTLPMLILAYAVLFLPQAIGSLRASLLQVPASFEEAGRSLGRPAHEVFLRVTLPLVRPGIFAGAALVFLTAMKELQATLLLSPYGFPTLATQVWSAVSEAFFARAAAPALVIILTSSVPMAYFVLREQVVGA